MPVPPRWLDSGGRLPCRHPLLLGLLALVVLGACADPDAPAPGAGGARDEPSEIAPECADLDDGLAAGGRDAAPPDDTGETLREDDGDLDAPRDAPPEDDGNRPTPRTHDRPEATLVGDLRAWADAEARDSFAGLWLDEDGVLTVAFADAVDEHRAEVHARFGEDVRVVAADHPYTELEAVNRAVSEQLGSDGEGAQTEPGTVLGTGIRDSINRVTVLVVGGDDDALAALTAEHGADRICFEVFDPPEPPPGDGPVVALAKVDGWRDELDTPGDPYALLEVADDRATAEQAWADNVPEGLAAADGDRSQPGLHGSLDDVDFDHQVLAVWSSGESSSCPAWLSDVDTTAAGEVHVSVETAGGVCTSDYNPYRLLLAVDRDRLPAPEDLPAALDGVPDGEARPYGDPG